MGNVAELLVRNLDSKNASPETVSQAESWAKKGLEVVISARKVSPIEVDVCEEAFAVLLYNVAMIREVNKKTVISIPRFGDPSHFGSFLVTQRVLVPCSLRVWHNPRQLACKRALNTPKTRSRNSTQARTRLNHSWLIAKVPKQLEQLRRGTNSFGRLSCPARCHREFVTVRSQCINHKPNTINNSKKPVSPHNRNYTNITYIF